MAWVSVGWTQGPVRPILRGQLVATDALKFIMMKIMAVNHGWGRQLIGSGTELSLKPWRIYLTVCYLLFRAYYYHVWDSLK